MTTNKIPSALAGCSVLPPMEATANTAVRRPAGRKAKGKSRSRDRRSRFATLNAFLDFTVRDLTRAEAVVWLVLFRDTKPDGVARTSQADLARRVGADVSTIKRAVARLRSRELLTVVFRGSLRRGPSAYRVHPWTKDTPKNESTLPS